MTHKKLLLSILFICVFYMVKAQSSITGNFIFNGLNRTYRLYIPQSYNNAVPVPLIINLHGYGSNALEQELYSNFKSIADTAGFIIVHPNGSVDGFGNQFWNTFGFSNIDDVGFISALIDSIKLIYNIDLNCIYSTGMSNGGFMSYKLACDPGNQIAAIASVTGTMVWNDLNNCQPAHSTPVMHIHGTADATVPYNGSMLFAPVDTIIDFWIQENNCDVNAVFTPVPDINTTDNSTAEHYLYQNGNNGSTVELYKIIGGGHSWPGAPVVIDVTNQDINASIEIWKFFRKYKLNILTPVQELTFQEKEIFVTYPNPSTGNVNIKFLNKNQRSVLISDLLGRFIYELNCVDCNLLSFNINSKGLYLITIKEDGKTLRSKILIN